VPVLLHCPKKPIVLLALAALLIAQAAAGLHALKHFGSQGDPLGLPGHHVQLCLECASFAPLGTAHSGDASPITLAIIGTGILIGALALAPAGRTHRFSFRSRAPPR